MFAAYNVVAAPKRLVPALETGHSLTTEQTDRISRRVEEKLKENRAK